MNKQPPVPIRRDVRVRRRTALRQRARFRLLNLAISGCILFAAHGVVFHFITRNLG